MEAEYTYEDGTYYKGEVNSEGLAHGYGYCRYPSGVEYRGYFVNNLYHGHGTMSQPGGWSFDGEFKEGYYDGYFQIRDPEGNLAKGMISKGYFDENNRLVGVHKMSIRFHDGDTYEGEVNGLLKPDGRGVVRTINGNTIEGEFRDGVEWGTVVIRQAEGGVFRGRKEDGKMVGMWTMEWPGFIFTGVLNNGSLTDSGEIEGVSTGTIIERNAITPYEYNGYLNGRLMPDGRGTIRYEDGRVYSGIWTNGHLYRQDPRPKSTSYSSGKKMSAAAYTILENQSYQSLLIYRGDDTYNSPLYKVNQNEISRVRSGSGYLYIRYYDSGDIAFTVVKGKTEGIYFIKPGDNSYGSVQFTVRGDCIANGEDSLMNHISYRIRSVGSGKRVVEYD